MLSPGDAPAALRPDTGTLGRVQDGDDPIRSRLEACKQGIMQLDVLRSKHQRLMEDMRDRLPPIPGSDNVISRVKRQTENDEVACKRESVQSNISNYSVASSLLKDDTSSRCESPFSGCVSHRSSVSIDSGCAMSITSEIPSAQPPTMTYNTFRKLSMEDRARLPFPNHRREMSDRSTENSRAAETQRPQMDTTDIHLVATTIESATCLRPRQKKNHSYGVVRPRSMYAESDRSRETEQLYAQIDRRRAHSPSPPCNPHPLFDSHSFSAITPPPMHRKFGVGNLMKLQLSPPSTRTPLSPIRNTSNGEKYTVNVSNMNSPFNNSMKNSSMSPVNTSPTFTSSTKSAHSMVSPRMPSRILRSPQKPDQTLQSVRDAVFRASRIFVERSPMPHRRREKLCNRPQSMYETQRDSESVFCAQPAVVLSRQTSYATPDTSPTGARKFTVAANIARFENHHKREKDWHESEAL